jgi:tripartite-type tricarboxylate transporter receptor subunit TctC
MFMKTKIAFCAALAVMGALVLGSTTASAQVSFKDRTIKIVIPYGPGGTYDKYGQTFASFFGKQIPGNPTVIVQHMPGAGGVKAMNWVYSVAPKDGFTMIVPLDNSVVNQLMRPERMRFDARKFTWLGSSNQTNIVLVVRSDTGVRKWQDMKTTPIIGGATGLSSTGYIMPGLVKGLFGFKIKMVTGYKGSSKTILSVEQGETFMAAYNWLAWSSKVPHWFKGEKPFARAILQMGVFKDPDLPDSVPMVSSLVTNEMDRKAVDFIKVLGLLGRGLAVPPGTPKDVIKTLRTAYDKMNADPAFAAALKKRRLRLIPSTGAQIQKIVNAALDSATPAVVQHARNLIYGKKK